MNNAVLRIIQPVLPRRPGNAVAWCLVLLICGWTPGALAQQPADGSTGTVRKERERLKKELQLERQRIQGHLPESAEASMPVKESKEGSESTAATLHEEIEMLRSMLERSLELFERLEARVDSLESGSAPQQTPAQEQSDRLDELEEQVADIEDRVGSRAIAKAFDAESLDIGGFLTQSFSTAIGDDSSEASFNQTQFELLLRSQINKNWSFFAALGFLREADLDFSDPNNPNFRNFANRVPQILAWANYRHSDAFQLQFGRFVNPKGIINIEHFPPVLLETNQPQFLRPFSGASLFPNFVSGFQIHGKAFVGSTGANSLDYNIYTGAFNGGDADDFVAGGRLAFTDSSSGMSVGVNYEYGRREAALSAPGHFSIVGPRSLTTNTYNVVGADLLIDKGRLLWKNEAYFSFENGQDDRVAAYTQPGFRLNDQWIAFYRFDYFDPGQGLTDSVEHVVGLNYLPTPTIRIRGAYFFKNFENPRTDSSIVQLSATFSF